MVKSDLPAVLRCKCCVIGDATIGKTALVDVYTKGNSRDAPLQPLQWPSGRTRTSLRARRGLEPAWVGRARRARQWCQGNGCEA